MANKWATSYVDAGLVGTDPERPTDPVRPLLCGFLDGWVYTNDDQFLDAPLSLVKRYPCDSDGRITSYGDWQRVIEPGRFPFGLELAVCPPWP